ncbi:hypothetical protein BsWGS_03106 [Bradybaena similaris]
MQIYILCVTVLPLIRCLAAALGLPSILNRQQAITGEKYIFVGEDLRLTCSPPEATLATYSVHNISFSFSQPLQDSSSLDECLPMSWVHVDEVQQSASLVVLNATLKNDGQYTCHIGNKYCLGREDIGQLEYVDSDDVHVEYPPHNVSQFNCVFYNWNDFVNCTWQHPVKYADWSNINISAAYTVSLKNNEVHAYRCPHLTHNDCTFNSSEFFLANYYVIEVNVTNIPKSVTASKNFIVNANEAVKPAPVINLSANSTPGCITLSWEHSKKYQKEYRIRHQIVGVNNFEVVNDSITDTNSTLCGYHSYTHHNFSVDCKPANIYSGYWSDPVYINAWTPMTAPNVGPTTINGSYTTSKCVNGLRNVTLMWQDVEEKQRNGIISGYFIKHGEKYLKNVTSDNHLAVVELSCDSTSELTIFAYNKVGHSVKPSVLVISPINFAVPESIAESFVVEISDNANSAHRESLRAVWNMTEDTKILSYIIFWCLGQPGSTCEGPINWSEVSGSQRSFDLPTLEAAAQKYLFGISKKDIQTGSASSIFWTGCLFRHSLTQDDVKTVKSLNVLENGTGYVRVGWSQLQCSYEYRVKVSNYRVKWCEVSHCNDTDGVLEETVPATSSWYKVSPLTANQEYKFTVQAVADGHAGEEYEPWVKGSPHLSASSNFGLIALVVIIIPVLFLFYLSRKCYYRYRHVQKVNKRSILVIHADHQLNDSPHRSPTTSDRLMPGVPASTAIQYQANTATVVMNPGETTSAEEATSAEATSGEEAMSANTAGDSYADSCCNSRSPLIKETTQNKTRKVSQCLPDAPDYVSYFDSGGGASELNGAASTLNVAASTLNGAASTLNGGASALECSSQESGDTGVYKGLPTKKDSSKVGRSSTSVTTGTESVDSYVQVTDVSAGQGDNHVQGGTGKQIHGKINAQADQVFLCLNQEARVAENHYSNVAVGDSNVYDEIIKPQSPDDAVINVEPTGSSILGAQSAGINLGNSGSGRPPSQVTSSDVSFELYMNSSSEQSNSAAERPSCGNGYISHQEV